jgi:hypothetical protein
VPWGKPSQPLFQAVLVVQGVASPPKGPGHFPSVQVLDRTYLVPGNGLSPKARAALPGVLQAFLRRNPGGGPVPVLLYPRTEECRLDLGKTLLAKLYTTEPRPCPRAASGWWGLGRGGKGSASRWRSDRTWGRLSRFAYL